MSGFWQRLRHIFDTLERRLRRKQAEREDGQLLILTSEKEAAAGLSTLPSDVSTGKGTDLFGNAQGGVDVVKPGATATASPRTGTEAEQAAEHRAGGTEAVHDAVDAAVSAGLDEVLKATFGADYVTDAAEGQRVLEADRERRAKLMGTTTRNRQAAIGAAFDGRELTEEQRAIADFFSGKVDSGTVSLTDANGKQRDIKFRQGNEKKAGVKHSVYGHCNTEKNGYNPDEVALISDVIAKGERAQKGDKVAYKYTDKGVTYTVTTEQHKSGAEYFTNFYTNRKPATVENSTSNTAKQHAPQQSVSGAKLQKDSETEKGIRFFRTPEGEAYGFVKDGKIYIDTRVAPAESRVHEYSHLWAEGLRHANPEAWERLKAEMLKDKALNEYVKKLYPELEGDGLVEEVFAHFSGKRGAERLRAEYERMSAEAREREGLTGVARVKAMFDKLRKLLSGFWQRSRDLFAGRTEGLAETSGEDFADMTLGDLLGGFDPRGARAEKDGNYGSDRKNRRDGNNLTIEENGDIRFQFLGEQGAKRLDESEERNHRIENLDVARAMETGGKDSKAIKMATGWERGADGKWRYEIEDFKDIEKSGNMRWLKAHPDVRRYRELKKKSAAALLLTGKDGLSKTERAELGRLEQELGDKYRDYDFSKPIRNVDSLRLEDYIDADSLFAAYPALRDVRVKLEYDKYSEKRGSFKEEVDPITDESRQTITLNTYHLNRKEDYAQTLAHEVQHAIQSIEGFAKGGNPGMMADAAAEGKTPFEAYRRLAGEVEARNVSKRYGMSEAERRASLAADTEDVAREDQIFLMGGDEAAEMSGREGELYSDGAELLYSDGSNIERVKDKVLNYFHSAIAGKEQGKGKSIGKLTAEGRAFLESVSGLKIKEDVDFILNPADLRHIHNEHYGANEKDKGNNIPLTDDDIRNMVDVISNPERVVYGINKKTGNKVFIFLSSNPNGTYNLAEVYTDRRGNLTAKSFYNTKKTISRRVNELLTSSPHLTSATEGASSSSSAKVPILFDISKSSVTAKREAVEAAAEKLNTRVNVIEDVKSIKHSDPEKQAKRQRSKGWIDLKTGEINIVLENCDDVDDAVATVMHETVAHKGLRELIGKERYQEFLDTTYEHLRDELKKGVDNATGRAFMDALRKGKKKSYEECRREAVDELFGRLAEKPFDEMNGEERTLWKRLKAWARDLLDKFLGTLKLPKWFKLGDNELRYMLWRSKERLERGKESVIDTARDIAKREELGIGEDGDVYSKPNNDDIAQLREIERGRGYLESEETREGEDGEERKVYKPRYEVRTTMDDDYLDGARRYDNIDEAIADMRERPEGEDSGYYEPMKEIFVTWDEVWLDKDGYEVEDGRSGLRGEEIDDCDEIVERYRGVEPVAYKTFTARDEQRVATEDNLREAARGQLNGLTIEEGGREYRLDASRAFDGKYSYVDVIDAASREKVGDIQLRLTDHSRNPGNDWRGGEDTRTVSVVLNSADPTEGRWHGGDLRYGEETDAERIVEDVRARIEEIVAGESWGEVQTLNGGVEERNRILSPKEAKERMKELSSRHKSRSAVMLDEDLPREEFIELLKAAGMPEADVEAIQSEDIKEFVAILKEVFATSPALYFPETGKIYIFADNIKAGKAETIFFHENLHGILHTLYGEGTREIADTYWQSAKDRKGRTKREIVENRYREEKRAEEYFVYHLAQSMADGDFRGIDEALPSEKHKAILNEIFNEIGYDRE